MRLSESETSVFRMDLKWNWDNKVDEAAGSRLWQAYIASYQPQSPPELQPKI